MTYARANELKKTCRKQYITEPIPSGKERSTTSNSLPNLVRSCPLGVDEKKDIGAPNTDFNMAWWMVLDALTPTFIVRNERIYMVTDAPIAANTS